MVRNSEVYSKRNRYEHDLLTEAEFITAVSKVTFKKISRDDVRDLVGENVIFPLATISSKIILRRIPCTLTDHLYSKSTFQDGMLVNKCNFIDLSMRKKELVKFYKNNHEALSQSNWGAPNDNVTWPTDAYITSNNKVYIDSEYYNDILTVGYADIGAFLMPDITRLYPFSEQRRYLLDNSIYHDYMDGDINDEDIEGMRFGNPFQSNDHNHKKIVIYPDIDKNILIESELQQLIPYVAYEAYKFLQFYISGPSGDEYTNPNVDSVINKNGINKEDVLKGYYDPKKSDTYFDIVDRILPIVLHEIGRVFKNHDYSSAITAEDQYLFTWSGKVFKGLLALASVADMWVPYDYAEGRLRITHNNIRFTEDQVDLAGAYFCNLKVNSNVSVSIRKKREVYYRYCMYRHFTNQIIDSYDRSIKLDKSKRDIIEEFIQGSVTKTQYTLYNDNEAMKICAEIGGKNASKDYEPSISPTAFIDKHLRFSLDDRCDEYPDIFYSVSIQIKENQKKDKVIRDLHVTDQYKSLTYTLDEASARAVKHIKQIPVIVGYRSSLEGVGLIEVCFPGLNKISWPASSAYIDPPKKSMRRLYFGCILKMVESKK